MDLPDKHRSVRTQREIDVNFGYKFLGKARMDERTPNPWTASKNERPAIAPVFHSVLRILYFEVQIEGRLERNLDADKSCVVVV
jgi:hypothetical protein